MSESDAEILEWKNKKTDYLVLKTNKLHETEHMCYYNSIQLTKKKMLELNKHKKEIAPITKTVQSGFSYDAWPIIVADPTEGWKAELAHWEFIPWWINDGTALLESRKKFTTLNATAEKLLESKMYKSAAAARRCLVLSSGFYEWRHFKPVGAKKEQAYPYHISVQSTEEELLFYMEIARRESSLALLQKQPLCHANQLRHLASSSFYSTAFYECC